MNAMVFRRMHAHLRYRADGESIRELRLFERAGVAVIGVVAGPFQCCLTGLAWGTGQAK
jgi:hypothetical protein